MLILFPLNRIATRSLVPAFLPRIILFQSLCNANMWMILNAYPIPPLVGQTFWRSNDAGAIASDDEPPMTSQSSLSPPLNPKPCSQLIPTKKLRFCSRLAAPFSKTAFPPTPDRCEDVNFLVHRRTLFVNSDDCSSLPRSPLLTSQKSTSLAD